MNQLCSKSLIWKKRVIKHITLKYFMNLYIRYFDKEVVVQKVEEAVAFLSEIPGFEPDDYFVSDFVSYVNGPILYPKRYKVRNRSYFIVIKTTAKDLEEFKANGANAPILTPEPPQVVEKERPRSPYQAENVGWYEAEVTFNRVLANPVTGKSRYFSTDFIARVKAISVQDCYERVIDYLRHREDIDSRSQFPSIKGRNFRATFLGLYPKN